MQRPDPAICRRASSPASNTAQQRTHPCGCSGLTGLLSQVQVTGAPSVDLARGVGKAVVNS
eukprot:3275393-Pleurochrysis_carterae.AAC.3